MVTQSRTHHVALATMALWCLHCGGGGIDGQPDGGLGGHEATAPGPPGSSSAGGLDASSHSQPDAPGQGPVDAGADAPLRMAEAVLANLPPHGGVPYRWTAAPPSLDGVIEDVYVNGRRYLEAADPPGVYCSGAVAYATLRALSATGLAPSLQHKSVRRLLDGIYVNDGDGYVPYSRLAPMHQGGPGALEELGLGSIHGNAMAATPGDLGQIWHECEAELVLGHAFVVRGAPYERRPGVWAVPIYSASSSNEDGTNGNGPDYMQVVRDDHPRKGCKRVWFLGRWTK